MDWPTQLAGSGQASIARRAYSEGAQRAQPFRFLGEDLVAPVEEFDAIGVEYDLATPYWYPSAVDDVSIYSSYVDPPFNVQLTSPEMADKLHEVVESDRLSQLRAVSEVSVNEFYTLLLVTGSMAILVSNNCRALHEPIRRCYVADKICRVRVLFGERGAVHRASRLGANLAPSSGVGGVTGHPSASSHLPPTASGDPRCSGEYTTPYDYSNVMSNYPFIDPADRARISLLRDAVGPDGQFLRDTAEGISVVMDAPFLTIRFVPESRECGRAIVAHLVCLQLA